MGIVAYAMIIAKCFNALPPSCLILRMTRPRPHSPGFRLFWCILKLCMLYISSYLFWPGRREMIFNVHLDCLEHYKLYIYPISTEMGWMVFLFGEEKMFSGLFIENAVVLSVYLWMKNLINNLIKTKEKQTTFGP